MSIAELAYRTAMPALAYAAAPFFALSARGKIRLRERYGHWSLPPGRYLWLHGASLGEVQGIIPVCRYLRERHPGKKLLLTATSPTGLTAGLPFVHEGRLLPFDCRSFLDRALSGIELDGFIFGETELWPTLLRYLEGRAVPRCLINARISDSTTGLYRRFRGVFSPHIHALTAVCAGDSDSLQRLLELGAPAERTTLTGNAKFDRTPLISSAELAQEVRTLFLEGSEPVVTLASIHPEEAAVWIPALKKIAGLPLRIVVAPRHTEKFEYFASALSKAEIPFERRSALKQSRSTCKSPVLLLDTLGELESVYSFSTAAFIGGTIRDIGGHNPLEAAMYGVYLCAGPSRWNIKDIASDLTKAGALEDLSVADEAHRLLIAVAKDPELFRRKGAQGKAVVERARGATTRIVRALTSAGVLNS